MLQVGIVTASLDHETCYDPMKDQAIVEAFIHELEKVAHRERRFVGIEFDVDIADGRCKTNYRVVCGGGW